MGRDSQNNAFKTWTMEQRPSGFTITPVGPQIPTGLTLKRDEVVFLTEVFASVDTMFLSRQVALDSKPLRSGTGIDLAYQRVTHMSRSPSADGLTAQGTAPGRDCLT